MEPKLKLLVHQNVVPNLIVIPKRDNPISFSYAKTWQFNPVNYAKR